MLSLSPPGWKALRYRPTRLIYPNTRDRQISARPRMLSACRTKVSIRLICINLGDCCSVPYCTAGQEQRFRSRPLSQAAMACRFELTPIAQLTRQGRRHANTIQYPQLISLWRSFRGSIAPHDRDGPAQTSPALIYAAVALALLLAILEVDLHRDGLESLGLLTNNHPIETAFMGP
jgi:hypothetical protein